MMRPEDFRSTVTAHLESAERARFDNAPPGSVLELAFRVSERCREICEIEQCDEVTDEIYRRAVWEIAPRWAPRV